MSERLFIAALPTDADRERIAQVQCSLRHALGDSGWRWLEPDDFHLTLRFLGAVTAAQRSALDAVVQRLARTATAAELAFSGFAAWPPRLSRVLVARFEDSSAIAALNTHAEQAVQALGFAADSRAFRPHITLARGVAMRTDLPCIKRAALNIQLCAIGLFRSLPAPKLQRYELLQLVPLGGA